MFFNHPICVLHLFSLQVQPMRLFHRIGRTAFLKVDFMGEVYRAAHVTQQNPEKVQVSPLYTVAMTLMLLFSCLTKAASAQGCPTLQYMRAYLLFAWYSGYGVDHSRVQYFRSPDDVVFYRLYLRPPATYTNYLLIIFTVSQDTSGGKKGIMIQQVFLMLHCTVTTRVTALLADRVS